MKFARQFVCRHDHSDWSARLRPQALLILLLLSGCVSQGPTLSPKVATPSPVCGESTGLSELIGQNAGIQPQQSRLRVLDTGDEALRVRAALIEAATCQIDIQYYIWNSDTSGRYLTSRLIAAADRGVRIRLLLDDMNVASREHVMAQLATHPNVALQIYNPFSQRRGLRQAMNLASEFGRLNRRMHVKSFTVDHVVTILGGRNIGDEYFDLHHELNFRDRDVLVSGPVVEQTMAMFEEFWNWRLSRPVSELTGAVEQPGVVQKDAWILEAADEMDRLRDGLPRNQIAAGEYLKEVVARMISAPAHLIFDSPPDPDAPGASAEIQRSSLALMEIAADTRSELMIESAYLVTDAEMLNELEVLRDRGVRVAALTNSLASNDVTANHASYARQRKAMIRNGIELFELRPDAASCPGIVQNGNACGSGHIFGLHAKTYVMDRQIVYIGSLNLNLRSRYLNAEAGVVVESPQLAVEVADAIEINLAPANSWRPELDEHNRLRWIEGGDGNSADKVYDHEPEVSWMRRFRAGLIALFPVDRYF